MNKATETKLRSTVGAIVAALVMFGPDILQWLDAANLPPWARGVAKGLALLIGLCVSGKAVAVLNFFLPTVPPAVVDQPANITPINAPIPKGPMS